MLPTEPGRRILQRLGPTIVHDSVQVRETEHVGAIHEGDGARTWVRWHRDDGVGVPAGVHSYELHFAVHLCRRFGCDVGKEMIVQRGGPVAGGRIEIPRPRQQGVPRIRSVLEVLVEECNAIEGDDLLPRKDRQVAVVGAGGQVRKR